MYRNDQGKHQSVAALLRLVTEDEHGGGVAIDAHRRFLATEVAHSPQEIVDRVDMPCSAIAGQPL